MTEKHTTLSPYITVLPLLPFLFRPLLTSIRTATLTRSVSHSQWTAITLALRFPTAAIRRGRSPAVVVLGTRWCRRPSFRSRGWLASRCLLDSVRPRFLSLQFFSLMLKSVVFTLLDCCLDRSSWFFCLIAEKMIESKGNKICLGAEMSRTQRYNSNFNGNISILALHRKYIGMALHVKKCHFGYLFGSKT